MSTCTTFQGFLTTADADRLLTYLCEEVEDEKQGRAAMQSLLVERPDVAHDVLCRLYDVSYYKVADSCFRDQAPAEEQEMWFIATAVDSAFESEHPIPSANSEVEARTLAVRHLKLDSLFFGTTELTACTFAA